MTAYQRRATAKLLAGSPERDLSSFVFSSSSRPARLAAIDDLRHAVTLGGDDYVTLVNLGANYFHVSDYVRAEELSRRAIASAADLPIPWSNLALALAGQGRDTEATDTARHTIELILKRRYDGEKREMFASFRATLETLADQSPGAEPLARQLQAMMAAAQAQWTTPTAPDSTTATVSDAKATSQGATLFVTMNVHTMPKGSRFAYVVSYRPAGQPDWSEPGGQSLFTTWPLDEAESTPYTLPIFVPGCRTSGAFRVDIYSGARRLATATATQQTSQLTFLQHYDAVGGLAVCRPDTWTLDATLTGTADIGSPDGRRSLSIRALPLAAPPTTLPSQQALIGEVLDRLRTKLSPLADKTGEAAQSNGLLSGTAWFLRLSPTEDGYLWAAVTPGGFLLAMYGRYPTGNAGELQEVLQRSRYVIS